MEGEKAVNETHMIWALITRGLGIGKATPSPLRTRIYGTRLERDLSGVYPLPAGAIPVSLVLSVNRLPYYAGIDYDVVGTAIVPRYEWNTFGITDGSGTMVMLDYDR